MDSRGIVRALAGLFVEPAGRPAPRPRLAVVEPEPQVAVVDATRDADGARRLVDALNECGGGKFEMTSVERAASPVALLIVDSECSRAYRALLCAELSAGGRRVVIAESGRAQEGAVQVELGRRSRFVRGRGRDALTDSVTRVLSRLADESGQSAIALVAAVMLTFLGVAVFAQFGGAFIARGREQRAADLAATAGARRMGEDLTRVMSPARLRNGAANPVHLTPAQYKDRARSAALAAAHVNGLSLGDVRLEFSPGELPASLTVNARKTHVVNVAGRRGPIEVSTRATAALQFAFAPLPAPRPARGGGGGYLGPLSYRQGKPMRPDVAAAFDRMSAAAARADLQLTVNSALRSDAEQARLFARRPNPKWVAPPGTSLHRYGTELDLGPPAAYSWLAAQARRFGFIQRYKWEPWHYGFGANPRDVPAQYERGSFEPRGGSFVGPGGLPDWVPERYRPMIAAAARRHNVQPVLLAAQIKVESGFNPSAVSPAGAQGIAQFMPATARATGLRDPFDPAQAIDAQARLMGRLIRLFSSIPKALAAYNAGEGAVRRFGGIPPYSETQAYVAKILALIGGSGAALDDPAFAGVGTTARVALVR